MSNNEQTATKKPVAKIRVGSIIISIFENEGKNGTYRTGSVDRRYRDAEGNWHSTSNHGEHDLLSLAKAALLAHSKIQELQASAE